MVGLGVFNLFIVLTVAIGILLLVSAILQWLWNITMPDVFNFKTITYWQAFRLLLIAGILFGAAGANFVN